MSISTNRITAMRCAHLWLPVAVACGVTVAHAEVNSEEVPRSTVALATASGAEIQEVIVTANKRPQRLTDVGATITAPTAEQLQSAGVADFSNLNAVVSGFSAAQSYVGNPIFSIRGISFNAAQLSASPAVSVYLDEAPLPYSSMTGGVLLDVERVEVLKGPQGTLYGQNATGGSINVIAARPTSQFAAGFQTEVNNFGQTMVEGYISGPLTDTLRARLAASSTQGGAWQQGYYLSDRDNGRQNKSAGRLLLDWTPTDALVVALNLNGNIDRSERQQLQLISLAPANPAAVYPGLLTYHLPTNDRDVEIPDGLNTHSDNALEQAVLRVDYHVSDALTLTSITDYAHYTAYNPLAIAPFAYPLAASHYGGSINSFSQELRAAGRVSSRLEYIIGANLERANLLDYAYSRFDYNSGLPFGTEIDGFYHPTSRSSAAFANLNYEISSKVHVSLGARYTATKQTLDGCVYDGGNGVSSGLFGYLGNLLRAGAGLPPGPPIPAGGCITINDVGPSPDYLPIVSHLTQKQNNVPWRAEINYHPVEDALLYASVSRGFKAGLFPVGNQILQSEISPILQEQLTSYEVGAKLSAFERRIQANVAIFYSDYINKQFFTYGVSPVGTVSTVVNIPKSKAQGLDLDVTAIPVEGLTLRASGTYLDTKVGPFEGYDYARELINFNGKAFNYAPPYSATFDVEYKRPLSSKFEGYIGAGAIYNDVTYGDLGEVPATKLPAYVLLSTRVGLEASAGWFVELWGRNLTDKYYWTGISPSVDSNAKFAGMPRTYGIRGGKKW